MKLLTSVILLIISMTAHAQNALNFDGIDDYAQATQAGPTGNMSRTVEAWVNMSAVTSTQQVIANWGDMATGQRFTLNIINGLPRIEVGNSGFSSTTALTINTWHHLAGVYDQITDQLLLYVDGNLKASGTPTVIVNTNNLNGIVIGRRIDSINYFQGNIDELRIWSVARTQSHISTYMNSEFCSTVPGLVAYFNFNQGLAGGNNTGQITLNDLSGNNNNCSLYNFALSGNASNWLTGKPLSTNTSSTINPISCGSYTSPSGLYIYNSNGTYFDTIPNSTGCDSVITINFIIHTIDTSVTQNGTTLTSNQSLALYHWLDCNNGYSAINGATSQSYTPATNGSYAVEVSKSGCTDTSSCFSIQNVGINEWYQTSYFNIYPNPFSDIFILKSLNNLKAHSVAIKIFNALGVFVFEKQAVDVSSTEIDLRGNGPGLYYLELITLNGIYRQKLIKK